jgi:ribosomal protein S18 acetylase RimI-like enzyme
VIVHPITGSQLSAAARLVARLQRDPAHYIGYLDIEVAALEQQLAELEPHGVDGVLGAFDGPDLLGILGADWALEPPRAWWHGPLVDLAQHEPARWDDVADRLYLQARALLPDTVVEEELLTDERNTRVADLAHRHGFVREAAAAVLLRRLAPLPAVPEVAGVEVRGFRDDDRSTIARLHDQHFPDAHLPGYRVDEADEGKERVVLVADRSGTAIGYLAIEQQLDGQGYIDFLGVDPSEGGKGIGAKLVAAGCAWLHRVGSHEVHLTVREANVLARRLYERLGFEEERILVPWRRRGA